jgi:hypothetical protein
MIYSFYTPSKEQDQSFLTSSSQESGVELFGYAKVARPSTYFPKRLKFAFETFKR